MRFGLFFLAEYLSVFAVSCLGTVIFLGGGTLPYPFTGEPVNTFKGGENLISMLFLNLPLIAIFMGKVSLYIFLMFWIRATLPRLRVDQLMAFAWKCMVPLCIVNIFIAAVWYEFVIRPGKPNYLLGWAVTLPMVIVSIIVVLALYRSSMKATPVEVSTGSRRRTAVRSA